MFDGDDAGKEGAISGYFVARKYMKTNVIKLYETYPGMSPDDFSSEMLGDIITQHIRF
jgi:DNA primase